MATQPFYEQATGSNPLAAFNRAVNLATYHREYSQYNGSILAKDDYVLVEDSATDIIARLEQRRDSTELAFLKEKCEKYIRWLKMDPRNSTLMAEALVMLEDERIADPEAPAGCIPVKPGHTYLFFGVAYA